MNLSLKAGALSALAAVLALATAVPAEAQVGEVLVGPYTYGWIGADLGVACGQPTPAVLTRAQLGSVVFDAAGNVVISIDERTSCPGGGIEDQTLMINATYTLDEAGELVLDLDPAMPGTDVATFRMTWDRALGTLVLDAEQDEGLPGMGVLVRNGSMLDPSALLGDYTLARVGHSQVAGGVEVRGFFGTLTFEPGDQYSQVFDSRTLDPSGSTFATGLTSSGTYLVQPDGTLTLDGGIHMGAVTPDAGFGVLVRRGTFGLIMTVIARKPTADETLWALDDHWWLAMYGASREEGPLTEVSPYGESGVIAADAQSRQMLIGHTEVWADTLGGGATDGFSFLPFEREDTGSYAIGVEPGSKLPLRLGRSEDVLTFAELSSPDDIFIGIAPRAWGPLAGDARELQVTAGGAQTLTVRTGRAHAGLQYFVLGSTSGTFPGLTVGSYLLPLNYDGYMQLTLSSPNQPPLVNSLGALDELGAAVASFTLPAATSPALVGVSIHHACVVLDLASPNPVVLASNPVSISLTN